MRIRIKLRYLVFVMVVVPFIYSLMSKGYKYSNIEGEFYPVNDVEFLYDLSYTLDGDIKREHTIFEDQIKIIEDAKNFIIVDLFLYNDEYDETSMDFPDQVQIMTDTLIEKRRSNPDIDIVFITDELNNFYGAYTQRHIKRLIDSGIDVTITDSDNIRDSNPLYSGIYKAYIRWFGSPEGGYFRNLFDPDGPKISVRSLLRLLNFKANHRKVLVTENCALVSSSNPHDPSGYHSNVAVKFYGKPIEDLIKSELGLVENKYPTIENFQVEDIESDIELRVVTEQKIYESLKDNLDRGEEGDTVNIGIFYIGDRKLLKDIGRASDRGVNINIIADLNKDAFGLEKNGSPNRPALSELVDKYPSINVRWYETNGEQFHTKMAYFDYQEDPRVILGSANFTRRNLQNYNLETDVEIKLNREGKLYKDIDSFYNRLWNNKGGIYTSPLEDHYEDGFILRNLWKIQEYTGLCTW